MIIGILLKPTNKVKRKLFCEMQDCSYTLRCFYIILKLFTSFSKYFTMLTRINFTSYCLYCLPIEVEGESNLGASYTLSFMCLYNNHLNFFVIITLLSLTSIVCCGLNDVFHLPPIPYIVCMQLIGGFAYLLLRFLQDFDCGNNIYDHLSY